MPTPTVRIVLYLPAPLNQKLREAAKADDRSISNFVQTTLRQKLERRSS